MWKLTGKVEDRSEPMSINLNKTTEKTQLTEASKRNKVEVKKKIGNVKINLFNGKVETQDIVSDIVRKATVKNIAKCI